MPLRVLRQFAAIVCRELASDHAEEVGTQPGRLFFPKRVHDLGDRGIEAPDGLSIEYVRLAVVRNEAVWKDAAVDSGVATLATHISQQIGQSVLLERRIVERLK